MPEVFRILSIAVAVNGDDLAWLEATRVTHDRPLPSGMHAYRWARYERPGGELRCTNSGKLFHTESDGAIELAAKLMRAATRPDVTGRVDVPRPPMRAGADAAT